MDFFKLKITREFSHEGPAVQATNPKDVVQYMQSICKPEDMWRENVWLLLCDKKNRIIGHVHLAAGGHDFTPVDLKAACRIILETFSDAVVLCHNHPSDDSRPSRHDIEETERFKKMLSVLDVKLLDHVIIADGEYFSFTCEKTYPMTPIAA